MIVIIKIIISSHHLSLTSPLQVHLRNPRHPGLTEPRPVGGGNETVDHIHTFLTTQGHGGPPRMSDQLNVGATSETAQTGKTIHTKHTLSQTNKENME